MGGTYRHVLCAAHPPPHRAASLALPRAWLFGCPVIPYGTSLFVLRISGVHGHYKDARCLHPLVRWKCFRGFAVWNLWPVADDDLEFRIPICTRPWTVVAGALR